jgi:hypothetical protein
MAREMLSDSGRGSNTRKGGSEWTRRSVVVAGGSLARISATLGPEMGKLPELLLHCPLVDLRWILNNEVFINFTQFGSSYEVIYLVEGV